MSANVWFAIRIEARAVRPTDRFRSLGDLEVVATTRNIANGEPTTVLEFADSNARVELPSDTVVEVWRLSA